MSDDTPEARPDGREARQQRTSKANNAQLSHATVVDRETEQSESRQLDSENFQTHDAHVPSNGNIIDKPTAQTDKWLDDAFELYSKIAKRQDAFFLEQTQLSYERQLLKPKLDELDVSIDEVAQLAKQVSSKASADPDAGSWDEARARFLAHKQSFQDHMQVISDREERTAGIEYEVANMQPKLLQIFDSHMDREILPNAENATESSSLSRKSSKSLHPLAREYFDTRGDLRLLQDKFQELIDSPDASDEDDGVRQLNLVANNGAHVEPVNDERNRQHEAILQELDTTEQRLTELWHQCQTAQLDVGDLLVETQRTRLVTEQALPAEQPSPGAATEPDPPPFLPKAMLPRLMEDFQSAPFVARGPSDFSKKRERIEDWVGKVALGDPAPQLNGNLPESPPEHIVSPPRPTPERAWQYRDAEAQTEDFPKDYVVVAPGGEHDPRYRVGMLNTLYHKALRRIRSSGSLRRRWYLQEPQASGGTTSNLNSHDRCERSHRSPNEI